MLASLLPGLRELRAPLAAGYLWLLLAWLALGGRVPEESEATGIAARLYDIRDAASALGLAVAISFVAYLLGSLSEAIASPIGQWLKQPFTSARAQSSIELVVDDRLRELTKRVPIDRVEYLLEEQLRGREQMRQPIREEKNPEVRLGRLIRVLEERIIQELDLASTRLIGEQPELFSTVDRLRAEAEFRFAIAPPLLALGLLLATTEHVLWLAMVIAVAVLGWQGMRRRTEANDVVADSLLLGRVEAPILERLRRAAEMPLQFGEHSEETAAVPSS
jgi:hypothetical protein